MSETGIELELDAPPLPDPEAGIMFPLIIGLAAVVALLAQIGALQ